MSSRQLILPRDLYVDDATTNDVLKVDGSTPKRLVAGQVAHSELTGVSADQHHNEDHRARHISGGGDAFLTTDLLEAIVKRIQTTTGPTTLLVGAVADGEYLKRSGTSIISDTPDGVRSRFAQTADATVASTTSETSIIGTGSGTLTFPADSLQVGDLVEFVSVGTMGDFSGTHQLRAKLGSTVVADLTWGDPSAARSGMPYLLRVAISVRTTGASGAVRGAINLSVDTANASSPLSAGCIDRVARQAATIDTTGALAFELTVEHSVSHANNDVLAEQGVLARDRV